jgi:hypothetical protein
VAGSTIQPTAAALALDGPGATFTPAPHSDNFAINGNDGQGSPPAVAGCTPNAPAVPAISTSDQPGVNNLLGTIPSNRQGNLHGILSTLANSADLTLTCGINGVSAGLEVA